MIDGTLIIERLVQHDERLEKIEHKLSSVLTRDEFHTTMDKLMVMLLHLDQERVFSVEWIRRIESDVGKIKQHLQII